MKIDDVRIEEHGRWRELSLSFAQPGINVLYGPNEAGKSTLLRFLRGMLFGRRDPLREHEPRTLRGRIAIEHDRTPYTIARHYDDHADRITITDAEGDRLPEQRLRDLLQGVDRTVYENVFAVGLREMQELGTLDDESVAEWLYGTSLGPAGRHLATISQRSRETRAKLHAGTNGIESLSAEYGRLTRELDKLEAGPRLDDLLAERSQLEDRLGEVRRRQETEQRNLRGYRLLARIHEPWQRVREYRAELDRLKGASRLPKDGLGKLDRIEKGLSAARRRREEARAELKSLTMKYRQAGEPDAFVEHACSIRGLLEVRAELGKAPQARPVNTEAAKEARQEFARLRELLGREWNDARFARAAAAEGGQRRLSVAAREYQKALVRKARLRRLRKRISKTVQKRQAELHGRTRDLAGRSVHDAIAERRARLRELEVLGRLRARFAELEQRHAGIAADIERTHERAAVPDWVYGVLCFFGIGGAVFCVLGVVSGISTSALVGAIYAFLGITCGGLAWALKLHFEEELRASLERLRDEEHVTEVELREVDQRIEKLLGQGHEPLDANATFEEQQERDAELVAETVRELIDLERLAERIESTVKLRKRQTALRNRFHSMQRELGTARQNWTGTLRDMGLTETLKVDEAFEEWDHVSNALFARQESQFTAEQPTENAFERLHARVLRLAKVLGENTTDVPTLLDRWEKRLNGLESWRNTRRNLRSRIRSVQSEGRRAAAEVKTWERRQRSLFRRARVESVAELRALAGSREQRAELEELLALAEEELSKATKGTDDLAIVEEQLVDFDQANIREAIELAELELEEIDGEINSLHERLGRVKQELIDAESDDRSATLRFERERVYEQLQGAYRELAAIDVVERSAKATADELERTYQPPTLAAASRYLERMTLGRYDRVWTPFGESRLLVNGHSGFEGDGKSSSFRVEQLSRGTREQVFLALRLALVAHLADDGVELPFVLDDVLVNFDRDRTEAAVDTLIDFAREGRQVLCLTCHEHVAEMFEQRGVEPIWLPSSAEARLAG